MFKPKQSVGEIVFFTICFWLGILLMFGFRAL